MTWLVSGLACSWTRRSRSFPTIVAIADPQLTDKTSYSFASLTLVLPILEFVCDAYIARFGLLLTSRTLTRTMSGLRDGADLLSSGRSNEEDFDRGLKRLERILYPPEKASASDTAFVQHAQRDLKDGLLDFRSTLPSFSTTTRLGFLGYLAFTQAF
eukprot:760467-Hanusia_phi.AAC.19